jgi:hypothetical protein
VLAAAVRVVRPPPAHNERITRASFHGSVPAVVAGQKSGGRCLALSSCADGVRQQPDGQAQQRDVFHEEFAIGR